MRGPHGMINARRCKWIALHEIYIYVRDSSTQAWKKILRKNLVHVNAHV